MGTGVVTIFAKKQKYRQHLQVFTISNRWLKPTVMVIGLILMLVTLVQIRELL